MSNYLVRGSLAHRLLEDSRNASISGHDSMEDTLKAVRLCLEAGMQVIVTPPKEPKKFAHG